MNSVVDGVYAETEANFVLNDGYNSDPVKEMIQVGDSLIFAFSNSTINADEPIKELGILNNGVHQFGKNTTSLGVDGQVFTMVELDNKIYVGGSFKASGETYLEGIGVFENDEWNSIGYFGSDIDDAQIYSLMSYDKYVFVGGKFEFIDTPTGRFYVNNAAIYDTSNDSWSSMGDLSGYYVYDMEKVGNTIYAIVYDYEESERKFLPI
jgi:hypothetical protein